MPVVTVSFDHVPFDRSSIFRLAFGVALLFAPLFLPPPLAGQPTDTEIVGTWRGAIEIPGRPLEIGVVLEGSEEAGWTGTIDIPIQGIDDFPLLGVTIADDAAVRFSIDRIPGDPTFDGRFEDQAIRGTFSQGGASFPFSLERGEVAPPPRPQTPEPPFPYRVEELTYASGDETLAGTLTLPAGEGPFPAIVLLSGSGAQDRDSTLLHHKPFAVIADHLTRAGLAVLRVDDRGVGGSTGDVSMSTTSDFADDALAGVRALAEHAAIDAERIGLLGHSEGAITAPLAASRSDEVAFLVLLAGPAVPGREILAEQSERTEIATGLDSKMAAKRRVFLERALDVLATDPDPERRHRRLVEILQKQQEVLPEATRSAAGGEEAVETMAEQLARPWFRYFLEYDPAPALRLVSVPTLALFAEKDLQVPPDQSRPAAEAALERSHAEDVTVEVLDGLNHLFQPAPTGHPAEYSVIETTFAPSALDRIGGWLTERFVEGAPTE